MYLPTQKSICLIFLSAMMLFFVLMSAPVRAQSGLPSEDNNYGYQELSPGAEIGAPICEEGDKFLPGESDGKDVDEDTTQDPNTNPSGIPGFSGGLYVPVKDFEAEAYLRAIVTDIDQIAEDIDAAAEDINITEDHTQTIKYYLRRLCEKEYIHDPQFQNEWAEVIGDLVNVTHNFVTRAYEGNPIFINNQYAYYTLVDKAAFRTFYQEVEESNIGSDAKREILQSLALRQYEYLFPHTNEDQWAPNDANLLDTIEEGSEGDPDGWRAYFTLVNRDEKNTTGLFDFIERELDFRRRRALEYEREKLDWGRGFFSYELCDLQLWTNIEEDRRNCRVVTPGALIQDQVSLVFGTAIRQMELADEFEERIARNTIIALNDILNWNSLMDTRTSRVGSGDVTLLTPEEVLADDELITTGDFNAVRDLFPWEFTQTVIDVELTEEGAFERLLIDEATEEEEGINI